VYRALIQLCVAYRPLVRGLAESRGCRGLISLRMRRSCCFIRLSYSECINMTLTAHSKLKGATIVARAYILLSFPNLGSADSALYTICLTAPG